MKLLNPPLYLDLLHNCEYVYLFTLKILVLFLRSLQSCFIVMNYMSYIICSSSEVNSVRPKIINVTQLDKYLREYDKHTAKEGRTILIFPFFSNWIGLLHCRIQLNCEVNLISFLTVCSTIFHHLYCSVALLRLLFVQLCDSLHEGVSRILSTFCLEMKGVLHVHFKSSCLYNQAEAAAFVYYFFRFFEIFWSIIRTNVRHSCLLHSRFRTSQKKRWRTIVTRSDEAGYIPLIL